MAAPIRAAAGMFNSLRRYPRPIRLPAFKSVMTNTPLTIDPPMGVTYQGIELRFTSGGAPVSAATIKADVTKIRAVFDSDPYVDASAAELSDLSDYWNARYGLVNIVDGGLMLTPARPWEQESSAQDGPAWGCALGQGDGYVNSFQLEVTLANGSTIDGITAWGYITPAEPMGRHYTLRRVGLNFAATGDDTVFDWPKFGLDVGVYAFHINKSGGTGNSITDIQMMVDTLEEIPRLPYGVIQSNFRRYGLTQQTGWTHIPFNFRGRPLDALPMVMQDLRLVLAFGVQPNNYSVLIEGIEGVDPALKAG